MQVHPEYFLFQTESAEMCAETERESETGNRADR